MRRRKYDSALPRNEFERTAAALRNKPASHTQHCLREINRYWRERGFLANARVDERGRVVSDMIGAKPMQRIHQQET